jgi:hypothetical protein
MSRDLHPDNPQDTRDEARRTPSHHRGSEGRHSPSGRGSGGSSLSDRQEPEAREQRPVKPDREDSPRAYYLRDREYLLRESEILTLSEVGRFRVVAPHDLAKYGYAGDSARMERDIRQLKEQSLLSEKTLEISGRKTLRVVTLTKQGAKVLRSTNRIADEQELYHGLRKPKEAKHDADLYRLYQKEAARIELAGGRPLRIILDYELKRDLNRDLEALGPQKDDPETKQAVAEQHHVPVVNGKVQLPDLRIEYENAQGELDHTDAELATRHYRPQGLAAKATAGFSLYSHPEDGSRLRRILNDQDITTEILSL